MLTGSDGTALGCRRHQIPLGAFDHGTPSLRRKLGAFRQNIILIFFYIFAREVQGQTFKHATETALEVVDRRVANSNEAQRVVEVRVIDAVSHTLFISQ